MNEGRNRLIGGGMAGGARAPDPGHAIGEAGIKQYAAQSEFLSALAAEAARTTKDKSPIQEAIEGLMTHIDDLQRQLGLLEARLQPVMVGPTPRTAGVGALPEPNPESVLSMIDYAAYRIVGLEADVTELRERLQV